MGRRIEEDIRQRVEFCRVSALSVGEVGGDIAVHCLHVLHLQRSTARTADVASNDCRHRIVSVQLFRADWDVSGLKRLQEEWCVDRNSSVF
eukprot:m.91736 g.91736  ORF g.91736 m.91736 type:complete len:91 (-) comp16509_c0_seq3:460-732(-)